MVARRMDNLGVVRSLYESFSRGDVGAVLETLDPAFVWTNPGPPDIACFGTHRGREGAASLFAFLGRELDIRVLEPRGMLEDGDKVVVLLHQEATARATGRSFVQDCAHVWTLREGRPVHLLDLQDNHAVASALRR
jgi:ketosteroid isomerase-like protein